MIDGGFALRQATHWMTIKQRPYWYVLSRRSCSIRPVIPTPEHTSSMLCSTPRRAQTWNPATVSATILAHYQRVPQMHIKTTSCMSIWSLIMNTRDRRLIGCVTLCPKGLSNATAPRRTKAKRPRAMWPYEPTSIAASSPNLARSQLPRYILHSVLRTLVSLTNAIIHPRARRPCLVLASDLENNRGCRRPVLYLSNAGSVVSRMLSSSAVECCAEIFQNRRAS